MMVVVVRRKPGPWIDALQFTGTNEAEIVAFVGRAWKRAGGSVDKRLYFHRQEAALKIDPTDWVMRGTDGVLSVVDSNDFRHDFERGPEVVSGEHKS